MAKKREQVRDPRFQPELILETDKKKLAAQAGPYKLHQCRAKRRDGEPCEKQTTRKRCPRHGSGYRTREKAGLAKRAGRQVKHGMSASSHTLRQLREDNEEIFELMKQAAEIPATDLRGEAEMARALQVKLLSHIERLELREGERESVLVLDLDAVTALTRLLDVSRKLGESVSKLEGSISREQGRFMRNCFEAAAGQIVAECVATAMKAVESMLVNSGATADVVSEVAAAGQRTIEDVRKSAPLEVVRRAEQIAYERLAA